MTLTHEQAAVSGDIAEHFAQLRCIARQLLPRSGAHDGYAADTALERLESAEFWIAHALLQPRV